LKIEDGYIGLILNSKSGSSSDKQLVRSFQQYLREKGCDVRVSFTRSLEHVCQLATQLAVDYNCKLVISAGGDGTVRETAHGLEGSDKPLMIIPCGTENLLANELGYPRHLDGLTAMFEQGDIRPLDLGSANGQCFTSVAGVGFDGEVVHRMQSLRTGHISHLTYFWPLWRTYCQCRFQPIEVQVDGKDVFSGRGLVFVGNISRYAIGLQILQKADTTDGLLDVCIYRCGNPWHLLRHAAATVLKRHTRFCDVIYRQGRHIKISSTSGDIYTQLDGDPGPPLPLDVQIIPQAIKVLVPAGGKPAGIRTRLKRIFQGS